MRLIVWCSVLAAVILASSCSLQKFLGLEQSPPPPPTLVYKNPHVSCGTCHLSANPRRGGVLFAQGTDPSDTCLSCHDYKENHHPVDFTVPDATCIPLPLFDGKIRCLTCHEIHGGPDKTGTPRLLRNGPYPDRRTICFLCHAKDGDAAINPHRMLDESKHYREVNGKPVCLICHAKMPDPSKDYTVDVRFKADIGFLCWRCHPPMPDPFFSTHFMVKPSAKVLASMHQAEEREMVTLPLVPRGRITCSTCHNPHQAGVIQHDGAAKGADAKGKLRLPALCVACHPMY